MIVEIRDRKYLVTFENQSEKLIHTPDGPARPADAIPPEVKAARRAWGRYLSLKPPLRISVITTRCEIAEMQTLKGPERIVVGPRIVLSTGRSFYSQSEIDAGKKFSRLGAKAKSLRRALGTDPTHRSGIIWPTEDRGAFWLALQKLSEPRRKLTPAERIARGWMEEKKEGEAN